MRDDELESKYESGKTWMIARTHRYVYIFRPEYARYYLENRKDRRLLCYVLHWRSVLHKRHCSSGPLPLLPPGDSFTEAASALFQSNLLTALINAALGTFFFFFFRWLCQAPPLKTSSCFICRMMLKLLAGSGAERSPCLSQTHTFFGGGERVGDKLLASLETWCIS